MLLSTLQKASSWRLFYGVCDHPRKAFVVGSTLTLQIGNGGCTNAGTPYATFLTNVASYGYIAIANGPPGAAPPSYPGGRGGIIMKEDDSGEAYDVLRAGFSTVKDMLTAQDWVVKGNADRFGDVDKDFFITAGSSCGGLEAYSAAYHNDKVKLIVPFNSGVIDTRKKPFLKEIKAPVVLVTGGPKDVAYLNVSEDCA
jgi:dienelactone hydrolase